MGCKHGRRRQERTFTAAEGGHQQGPREGDMMRGLPGPQKYEGTHVQGVGCCGLPALTAPSLGPWGGLHPARVYRRALIACVTHHRRHKEPACWLAPTALHLLASPQLPRSQPYPHPVCVCVCVCTRMLACSQMCSSSACRMLCCLLISLGFAQTHMHSLIICCVSSLHGCTQTHTYTPSFCPSACLLMFNVSPIHTQL